MGISRGQGADWDLLPLGAAGGPWENRSQWSLDTKGPSLPCLPALVRACSGRWRPDRPRHPFIQREEGAPFPADCGSEGRVGGCGRIPAPSQPRLQLMRTILIMVSTKKGTASICTFTRTAVMKNTTRMATRVPRIRTDWGILPRGRGSEAGRSAQGEREAARGQAGAPGAHLWCRKELRQVKKSRGSMAHNVMTLLKTALSEFRAGEGTVGVAEGWTSLLSSAVTKDIFWDSSRRFVKYCGGCRQKP